MAPDTMPTVSRQLRHAGLRVTAPRHAVLEWLVDHPHATAEQVGAGVRERLGSISTQGVYSVLSVCVEAGLVRQIQPARHPARFERRTDDNHHHLVCRGCGAVVDVDCAVGTRPCLTPEDDGDFEVDEAEVVFWGSCPACRAGDSGRSAAASPDSNDRGAQGAADETMEA